jgi:hypothetical protein
MFGMPTVQEQEIKSFQSPERSSSRFIKKAFQKLDAENSALNNQQTFPKHFPRQQNQIE